MRLRAIRARLADDRGISMAELLIYSMLLSGVLIIVGALLINSLRTQNTVTTITQASTAGQLAARSIETGIRNSSTFKLITVNTSDQLLLARVSDANGAWSCQAWYYDNTNNAIRFKKSSLSIPSTQWSATNLAKWTLLTEGVLPPQGAAASAPIFVESGAKVTLSFRVEAGDHKPALISSSAARRLSQGSTQCFT